MYVTFVIYQESALGALPLCVNRLVTWRCLVWLCIKLQQLPLAVRRYVGGLTRASISVRQHGARAALERRFKMKIKSFGGNLLGRLTHRTYSPFLPTTGRITSSQVVKAEFTASVWDLWFSQWQLSRNVTPCSLEESEVSVFVGEGWSPLSEDAVWHVQHVTTAVVL